MAAPDAYLCVAFSTIWATILLYGIVRFQSFIQFCQSANTSGRYAIIKALLLTMMYAYAPLAVIGVTFSWVSYTKDWSAGSFFLVLPLFPVILFLATILVTHNDVSNFVDSQRDARRRLPNQPMPPPLAIGDLDPRFMPAMRGGPGPMMQETTVLPPPLPLTQKDDDAF